MKEINFVWRNEEIYFIPTISLHRKFKIVELCFLNLVVEICY